MTWSTDISKAPRGHYDVVPAGPDKTASRRVFKPEPIIAASACGVVCLTYWIDSELRWNMFAAGQQPIAWQSYPGPRAYVDDKGRTRYAVDLPPHPTVAEPWFTTFMREIGNAVPRHERQRACLDWIAARTQRVAA